MVDMSGTEGTTVSNSNSLADILQATGSTTDNGMTLFCYVF